MSQIELLFDNCLYSLKFPPIASTQLGATLNLMVSIVLKEILKQFLLHCIGYQCANEVMDDQTKAIMEASNVTHPIKCTVGLAF